jgi:hypothetical protein
VVRNLQVATKVQLLIQASTQLGYITADLHEYFAHNQGFTFFQFLAEEIDDILGKDEEILRVTATYPWSSEMHVFRKKKLNEDFETFCEHLREASGKDPEISVSGCKIKLLVIVARA